MCNNLFGERHAPEGRVKVCEVSGWIIVQSQRDSTRIT